MSPARVGSHRRTGPVVAPVLGELRRERAEVERLTRERDEARALVVELAAGEGHAACQAARQRAEHGAHAAGVEAGREQEAAERDRAWHQAADPIARGGPTHAALEILRWGPAVPDCPLHGDDCTGRFHYGDPRPGDYTGGPVEWPALTDAAAVAS